MLYNTVNNMFKIGDLVEVVGYPSGIRESPWVKEMETTIGIKSKVIDITERGSIKIEDNSFIYPQSSLRLVKEKKIMFKIGDKVKIVKKVTERTEDFDNRWIDDMDTFIGIIGTVENIHPTKGIAIKESNYNFPSASLALVKEEVEEKVQEQMNYKFDSLNSLLYYLADGNMILDSTRYCLYKIDNNVLKYKDIGGSVWSYCNTTLVDYGFYTRAGRPEPDWYEKEFKPCLCYVWDEDESRGTRVAIVEAYDKYEDYPFQTSGNWFNFAKPLTLEEVTLYCLECE